MRRIRPCGGKRRAPRLPNAFLREINVSTKHAEDNSSEDDDEVADDVYEYEEKTPQEESKKNKRFDPVENYEPELPSDFEDEEIASDAEEQFLSEHSEEEDDNDDERRGRMIQEITKMPRELFEDDKQKKVDWSDIQGDFGRAKISTEHLLEPLQRDHGYSSIRKNLQHLEKNPESFLAPLPVTERERIERKVAYEHSKKDITKWEPLVKRNREAPTLFFEEDVNLGYSTVGAIASEFKPRSQFEKKMAMLVRDPEVLEAHAKDGERLLELNKISIEDEKERRDRLAKIRSLLFRHELKAKHIKKIKSKTYHRLLKKDRFKAASAEMQMDPEAAKEYAIKQELKRAEERMTLKHKNSSKWAKRILKRGSKAMDEGTRAAVAEQLHRHALLTRKMNTMKDSSSDDDTSDDDGDEDHLLGLDDESASKVLNKAKEKTLKVIEEDDEIPKSGVLGLPFMERSLKKRKEEALEEARHALEEYDSSLRGLEDGMDEVEKSGLGESGRKVFGPTRKQPQEPRRAMLENPGNSSDSEGDIEETENVEYAKEANYRAEEIHIGTALIDDDSVMNHEAIYKSFDDISKNPGPKTSFDVAIFASDKWRKMKSDNAGGKCAYKSEEVRSVIVPVESVEGMDQHSSSESDEEIVDGFLSSEKPVYELPSQADLIHRAFAGDDVEAEFEKDKMEALDEENPEPEKPSLLPGWGQWTDIQEKRGMPSWRLKAHENAKREREEAVKWRKDARLKHVIISERIDKKAEKLQTKSLPFPYKSKEIFEQSLRMPIGPEFNPAVSVAALNRPEVVKKPGMIIKPIKYVEVDPHEKQDEPKRIVQNVAIKRKTAGDKSAKKGSGRKKSKANSLKMQ